MRKSINLIVVWGLAVGFAQAQTADYRENVTLGIRYGLGSNSNAYRFVPEISDYYLTGKDPIVTCGADLGISLSQKWRTRIECNYVGYSYGMTWQKGSTFDKTDVKVFNVDLNLKFDYRLLHANRFRLYVSPGFVSEFVVDSEYRNTFADGSSNYKKYNVVTDDHRDGYYGANLGLLMKYNVAKWLALKLDGGYIQFFQKYHADNDKSYSRLDFNAGVELKLF
ncbi:MAG: outer membrane beta-barrel protein [Breznakibacter sp.]